MAAKRYYHNKDHFNDEMKHDRGDRDMKYKGSEGHYNGMSERLKQESEDASMIREDHSAVANLPQNVIMRPYRKGGYGIPEELDDTLEGVDRQIGNDNGKRAEHMFPKKV